MRALDKKQQEERLIEEARRKRDQKVGSARHSTWSPSFFKSENSDCVYHRWWNLIWSKQERYEKRIDEEKSLCVSLSSMGILLCWEVSRQRNFSRRSCSVSAQQISDRRRSKTRRSAGRCIGARIGGRRLCFFLIWSNLFSNFWLIVGKLWKTRSRQYRSRFLKVNTKYSFE